jgi:hypothetical protein
MQMQRGAKEPYKILMDEPNGLNRIDNDPELNMPPCIDIDE